MSNNYNIPARQWIENEFKIISFSYPIKVNHSQYKRKQYMIVLFYLNKEKICQKKIFFGFKNQKNKLIEKTHKRRRIDRDPFHPAYWENELLNNKETMQESFCDLVGKVLNQQEALDIKTKK